jgi:hypothetical protein
MTPGDSPDGHFGNDDAVLVERGPHKLAEAVVVVHVGDDGELADLLERLEVQLVDVGDSRVGRDAEREFLQVSQAVREAGREFCPQLRTRTTCERTSETQPPRQLCCGSIATLSACD